MNTKVVKKFLYAASAFHRLGSYCHIRVPYDRGRGAHRAAYEKSDRIQRNSKNQGRPCNGRVPNCRRERRDGPYHHDCKRYSLRPAAGPGRRLPQHLLEDGRGFEWKPGASEGICYPCDETQMANYLVFWINRGGLYNYPLKYFPASQPDGTYNLDLPDSDPLKEDYPNVKVTVVAGKVWGQRSHAHK